MQIDINEYKKATLDKRLIAYVFDIFLCALIVESIAYLIESIVTYPNSNIRRFIEFAGVFLYFVVFTAERGQTPGKMLLKIKVVSTDGRRVDYTKSSLRFLGYIVNNFTFTVGYLWVAFDKNKQGFHDKIAGTLVIMLSKKGTLSP